MGTDDSTDVDMPSAPTVDSVAVSSSTSNSAVSPSRWTSAVAASVSDTTSTSWTPALSRTWRRVSAGDVREVQPRRGQPVARLGHRTVGPDDGVGKVGRHVVAGQVEGIFVEHLAAGRTDHRQPGDRSGHRHPEDNVHRTTPYSRPTHPIGFRSPPRNRYPDTSP
jgi:hypothetical protein